MKSWMSSGGYSVYRVLKGFTSVYMVKAGDVNILIDSGPKMSVEKLIRRINLLKEPGKLDYLVVTHTHFDHCQNVRALSDIFDPVIVVGESEREFLDSGHAKIPEGTRQWSKLVVSIGRALNPELFSYPGVNQIHEVSSTFTIPGLPINIVPTPGHSSGSISIILENELAIVGDTLIGFSGNSIFPPFADDTRLLMKSWEYLVNSGCHTFLPAHGQAIGIERLRKEYGKLSGKYRS